MLPVHDGIVCFPYVLYNYVQAYVYFNVNICILLLVLCSVLHEGMNTRFLNHFKGVQHVVYIIIL